MPEKASASFQLPAGEAEPSGQLAVHSPDAQRRGIEAFIRISRLAGAVSVGLYGLLYLQTGAWQMLVVAGGVAIAMSCLIPAYKLARRGNLNAAGYWLVFGVTLAYSASELGWTGVTGYIFGGGLLLIFWAGSIVLPRRWAAWFSVAGLFAAYIWLVNRFEPLPRYDATQSAVLRLYLPGVTAFLAVGLLWQLIRAYQGINTIRARMLVAFVLLVLVSATVVSAVSVIGNLAGGQRQVINQLESVVALKAASVEAWRQSLELNLYIELSREPVAQRMKVLSQASPNTADFQAAYTSQSNRFQQTVKLRQDFEALFLLDRQGRVLLSTDATQEGKIYSNQVFFQEGLKGSFVAPPLYDMSLDRTLVFVARPVVDEQEQVLGVLAGRASMAILSAHMLERAGLGETGETYLVGSNHLMLTESRFAKPEEGRIYVRSQGINAAIENQADGSGLYNGYRGVPVVGVYHWLPGLQVALVAEQDQAEAFQAIYATLGVNVGVTIAALLIAMGAALLVTRSIANPLASLTKTATQITAGDLTLVAPVKRKDEIGTLALAFNSMTAQLRDIFGSLEQQVEARTAQLRASADVGRAAVSTLDPNQLLREVVNLITDRFGFYYAAVFTPDETGQWAVLREATGEAGRVLKERGHKLEVGGQSMVGYVTTQRKARIALDVGKEAVRFANPLLPDTRSEIALPLAVGDRVLGALDVQSTQVAAFDEASAAVLQAMADQIAIALNNATLFIESQTVARRSRALYEASREVSRLEADPSATVGSMLRAASDTVGLQAWWVLIFDERRTRLTTLTVSAADQNWPKAVPVSGFENHPIVRSAVYNESHVMNDPLSDPYLKDAPPEQRFPLKTISVPIIARGASVGALVLGRALDQPDLAQGDLEVAQSLASLTAIAIENSRLLSQTQRALRELDEINRRLTGEGWAAFARRSTGGIMWISTSDRAQHETLPEVAEALSRGEIAVQPIGRGEQLGVAVPIKLRDVTIGALRLVVPQRAWNADTITTLDSIAGHVAQAAENARLLEQTQRTAQREKAIANAADKIHRSTDLDTVLRAAVAEINRITGLGGVSIQLGFGQSDPTDGTGHRVGTDGGK